MNKKIVKIINLFLVLMFITSCAYIIDRVYNLKQEEKHLGHLAEEVEQAQVIVQNEEIKDKIDGELRNI